MSKFSKIIYHPLSLLFLTIISVIFSLSLMKTTKRAKGSAEKFTSAQKIVDQREQEVDKIQDSFENSQQVLNQEKMIRNELLRKKAGEYVVQISDDQLQTLQAKENDLKINDVQPWDEWQKLILES